MLYFYDIAINPVNVFAERRFKTDLLLKLKGKTEKKSVISF